MSLQDSVAVAVDGAAKLVRSIVPVDSRTRSVLRAARGRLPRRRTPPPDPIGRVIFEFARAHPKAFFIQVGANDGVQRDPLRTEILARKWRGIMVEPVPYVYERLRRFTAGEPQLILENVAIADHDGTQELFYLPQSTDAGLPEWYDALASFRKEVVLKHREFIADIDERVASMPVPCVTFDHLCAKHGVTRVDIVQIDTEGYDYEVIKLIDLDRLRPKLVMFEHHHLDGETRAACNAHLQRHGYVGLSHSLDTVCLRAEELDGRNRPLRDLWETLVRTPDVQPL